MCWVEVGIDRLLAMSLGTWGGHPAILPDRRRSTTRARGETLDLSDVEGDMTQAMDRRAAAKAATETVLNQEFERAEWAATQRIRDRIHGIPSERRHVVTVGDLRVEVIETAAVEDALAS